MNRFLLLFWIVILVSCREEPAAFEHVNPLDPKSATFQLPELGNVEFNISSSRARFTWTGTFQLARVIIERKLGSDDYEPVADLSAGTNFWQDTDLRLPQQAELRYRLFSILGDRSSDTLHSPVMISTPCEWRYEMDIHSQSQVYFTPYRECTSTVHLSATDTITTIYPPSSAVLYRRYNDGPYESLQSATSSNRTFTVPDTALIQFRVVTTFPFEHVETWDTPRYIVRTSAVLDADNTIRGGIDISRPTVDLPSYGTIQAITQWLPQSAATQHGFYLFHPGSMEFGVFTTLPSTNYTITSLTRGRATSLNDRHLIYVSSTGLIGEVNAQTGAHIPFTLPAKDIPRAVYTKTPQNQFPVAIEDRDTGALSLAMFSSSPFVELWRIPIDLVPLHVVYRQSNSQLLLFAKGLQIRNSVSGAIVRDWDQTEIAHAHKPVPNAIRMAFQHTGSIVDYDLVALTSTLVMTGLVFQDLVFNDEGYHAGMIQDTIYSQLDLYEFSERAPMVIDVEDYTNIRLLGTPYEFSAYRNGLLHLGRIHNSTRIVTHPAAAN